MVISTKGRISNGAPFFYTHKCDIIFVMELKFTYDEDEDAWCILNFGKSSENSYYTTSIYKKLIEKHGSDATEEEVAEFIKEYVKNNKYSSKECIENYTNLFGSIKNRYQEIAERVFGVKIDYEITAYLTLNQRYPYGIEEKCFFVPFPEDPKDVSNSVAVHELWHFYTWHKFGSEKKNKVDSRKYNDIKESLTVLLNIECKELMDGKEDVGYSRHQKMRKEILRLWNEKKDIDYVWDNILDFVL